MWVACWEFIVFVSDSFSSLLIFFLLLFLGSWDKIENISLHLIKSKWKKVSTERIFSILFHPVSVILMHTYRASSEVRRKKNALNNINLVVEHIPVLCHYLLDETLILLPGK